SSFARMLRRFTSRLLPRFSSNEASKASRSVPVSERSWVPRLSVVPSVAMASLMVAASFRAWWSWVARRPDQHVDDPSVAADIGTPVIDGAVDQPRADREAGPVAAEAVDRAFDLRAEQLRRPCA